MLGRRRARPLHPLALFGALGIGALFVGVGCSREAEEAAAGPIEDGGVPGAHPSASRVLTPSPPSLRDARAGQEIAAASDAGRFCGAKDLPDCPLQEWMKRVATPAIQLGETSALGDAFDQIAALAPSGSPAAGYPNWVSIARDGADAARIGDIPAARAACRGCHVQYSGKYHAELRGVPLPPGSPRP